jgi:hypothetical protein
MRFGPIYISSSKSPVDGLCYVFVVPATRHSLRATSDAHSNANEGLQRCFTVDNEVLVPLDHTLFEQENDSGTS